MFYFFLQNVSGTFTAIISIISLAAAPNARTAAIYYFITALFVLLACFDTYFALPLNVSISVIESTYIMLHIVSHFYCPVGDFNILDVTKFSLNFAYN